MLALEEITKTELCKLHICSKGAIRLFFFVKRKKICTAPEMIPNHEMIPKSTPK